MHVIRNVYPNGELGQEIQVVTGLRDGGEYHSVCLLISYCVVKSLEEENDSSFVTQS